MSSYQYAEPQTVTAYACYFYLKLREYNLQWLFCSQEIKSDENKELKWNKIKLSFFFFVFLCFLLQFLVIVFIFYVWFSSFMIFPVSPSLFFSAPQLLPRPLLHVLPPVSPLCSSENNMKISRFCVNKDIKGYDFQMFSWTEQSKTASFLFKISVDFYVCFLLILGFYFSVRLVSNKERLKLIKLVPLTNCWFAQHKTKNSNFTSKVLKW